MTHYLMTVHGPAEMDEFGNYGSREEMEESFAATGVFNDQLKEGRLLGLRRWTPVRVDGDGGRRPG